MPRGRIYWPNCAVCQYIKRNPTIKQQIYSSTYYDKQGGTESLMEVFRRWGMPFPEATIYTHMRRHQAKPTLHIEDEAPETSVQIAETEVVPLSSTPHERGLDEVIAKGRQLVASGDIKINATALLTAIKTKSEIEKANKDRNLDAMKLMAGAFGVKNDSQA